MGRQIGEVDLRSGKFRRITNDLNNYSGQSLAITKDAKQLVAIQSLPDTGLYIMSSEPERCRSAVGGHSRRRRRWMAEERGACWYWILMVTFPP